MTKKKPAIVIHRDRDERGRCQTMLVLRDREGTAAHYLTKRETIWMIQQLVSDLNWRQ